MELEKFNQLLKQVTDNLANIINLADADISMEQCCLLLTALEKNVSVEYLSLSGNFNVGPVREWVEKKYEVISKIVSVLFNNKNLLVLDLSRMDLDDMQCLKVIRALKTNHTLLALDLSSNNLSEYTTMELCKILNENKTLLSVELQGNELGLEWTKPFLQLIEQGSSLLYLGTYNTDLDIFIDSDLDDAMLKKSNERQLFLEKLEKNSVISDKIKKYLKKLVSA